MTSCKPIGQGLSILFLSLFVFSVVQIHAQDAAAGKTVFMSKCAACHSITKDGTGPALKDLEQRHKWADHNELLKWINNPAVYMKDDSYTQGLKAKYNNLIMTGFADVTLKDVDNLVAYVNDAAKEKPKTAAKEEAPATSSSLIFGIISLILAVIAVILLRVNSNLKKLSDEAEGISRPDPVPFYKNKIYIAIVALLLFILAGYFLSKAAIGLGRQKDYQPEQPIYYSHKVHAGQAEYFLPRPGG